MCVCVCVCMRVYVRTMFINCDHLDGLYTHTLVASLPLPLTQPLSLTNTQSLSLTHSLTLSPSLSLSHSHFLGGHLSVVARDAGDVISLLAYDSLLYTCSTRSVLLPEEYLDNYRFVGVLVLEVFSALLEQIK